jgi:serine/threonine protein phosphatase 1
LFHQSSTPYFSDKLIITGHTITFTFPQVEPGQLVQGQGWLDIDTGAYHRRSGWLTGIDIDNWVVHQVNVHQAEARQLSFDEAVVSVTPEQLERRHHGAMKVA